MRIHDDGAAAGRAVGHDAGVELALDDVLQVLVDRQLDGRADRRRPLEPAERVPFRVRLHEDAAALAADAGIVGGLETAQAVVVDADVAEHVRPELLVGIEALVLLHEPDAVEIQLLDAAFLVGRDLAPHVGERAAVGEAPAQRRPLLAGAIGERAAERRSGRVRVADFRRHRIDRVRVDARRQHAALAIDDVAALGRCVDRVQVLPFGAGHHVGALDDLQIHQARFGAGDPHRQA